MTITAPRLGTLPWVYDDGGRADAGFKGRAGDCVTRAIAIAAGLPYRQVYDLVHEAGRTAGRASAARTGVPSAVSAAILTEWGWEYRPLVCDAAHLTAEDMPDVPVFIAALKRRHWSAVIDGVIHDTWNAADRYGNGRLSRVDGIWLPPTRDTAESVFVAQEGTGGVVLEPVVPAVPAVTGEMTEPVTATSDTVPHGLSAAVAQHRVDYWSWVEHHADKGLRADLIELRDHWRECNERFFEGRMHLPYITLTEPSAPQLYGQCCSQSSWGSRLEIRLRPSLLAGTHPHMGDPRAGRMQFVKDVLLHEMIHQHVMEHQPDVDEESYHGHGPVFTAHCNRIGALLGMPEVVVRNRKGKEEQPKSAQWPHCVAPERYLGAYHPHPEPVTTGGDAVENLMILLARLTKGVDRALAIAEVLPPDERRAALDLGGNLADIADSLVETLEDN